jgi:hypothetical protein
LACGENSNDEVIKNINRKLEYLNYIDELPRHLKVIDFQKEFFTSELKYFYYFRI